MRKIGKNIATGLMVTALFAASATTAFAASATINAYGTFGLHIGFDWAANEINMYSEGKSKGKWFFVFERSIFVA